MAPDALLHNLKHNRVLHARNLVVTIIGTTTPRVSKDERIAVEQIDDDFLRVQLTFRLHGTA